MNVNKIDSIKKIEKLGFKGVDVDIAVSLFEYGIAWKKTDKEIIFIYGITMTENEYHEPEFSKFDRCSFDVNVDIFSEFDWADFDAVCEYVGISRSDFEALPNENKIVELYHYYGEEIFGSSYWEGFSIKED